MKKARVSIAEEIFNEEKREPKPSPDKYEVHKSWHFKEPKVRGSYTNLDARTTFTEGFVGIKKLNNVPPVGKYDQVPIELYKTRTAKFQINSDNIGFRTKPIEKKISPSPNTYRVHESFIKT